MEEALTTAWKILPLGRGKFSCQALDKGEYLKRFVNICLALFCLGLGAILDWQIPFVGTALLAVFMITGVCILVHAILKHNFGVSTIITTVLIIVIGVSIPFRLGLVTGDWTRLSGVASVNSCRNNLRQINNAKDQWRIITGAKEGDPLDVDAVNSYIKNGAPACPDGGIYHYNSIGELPSCSIISYTGNTTRVWVRTPLLWREVPYYPTGHKLKKRIVQQDE
ncbi:hypothetical protein ACFLS1_11520 [Verrucomicrobiota bacterium]